MTADHRLCSFQADAGIGSYNMTSYSLLGSQVCSSSLILQADLKSLKSELQSHAAVCHLPYFSTNDIVASLAWMLCADAEGHDRRAF